jgi:LPS export ABC transporter protein LptC
MPLKLLTLIAVTTIVLLVFISQDELPLSTQPGSVDPQDEDQAFTFMNDVEIISTNQAGTPVRKLNSDSLRHYRNENLTVLSQPVLQVLNPQQQQWKLTAIHGVIMANSLITLSDNVVLENKTSDSDETKVNTSLLHYDTQNERLYTDRAILLSKHNLELRATGMVVDVSQQRVELKANVRGQYAPD